MNRVDRVYLAGPMLGMPDFNFPAFCEWADHLRKLGYTPVSPADKERLEGTDKPDWSKIPAEWSCPTGQGANSDVTPAQIRKEDFEVLLTCDGIAMLPGWEKSSGARAELLVAQFCGLSLYLCAEIPQQTWTVKVLQPLMNKKVETRVG